MKRSRTMKQQLRRAAAWPWWILYRVLEGIKEDYC